MPGSGLQWLGRTLPGQTDRHLIFRSWAHLPVAFDAPLREMPDIRRQNQHRLIDNRLSLRALVVVVWNMLFCRCSGFIRLMTFAGGGQVAARKVVAEGRRNAGFARGCFSRAFDLICPVLREALRLLSGGAFFADGGGMSPQVRHIPHFTV